MRFFFAHHLKEAHIYSHKYALKFDKLYNSFEKHEKYVWSFSRVIIIDLLTSIHAAFKLKEQSSWKTWIHDAQKKEM